MHSAMAAKLLHIVWYVALLHTTLANDCPITVEPIDFTLNDQFCDQPWFVAFLRKDPQSELIDNICQTYFPLPDDPDTYRIYASVVFCDGSNNVHSFVSHQREPGVQRTAYNKRIFDDTTFSYPGCDTYLIYRTTIFGEDVESEGGEYDIQGLTTQCRSLPLSCLSKVEEEIEAQGFPEQDYYILPMKLPNRCVTQQLRILPPNPFYNELPAVGPGPVEVLPGPAVLGHGPGLGVFPGPGILPGPGLIAEPVPYPGPNTNGITKLVSATAPHLVSATLI